MKTMNSRHQFSWFGSNDLQIARLTAALHSAPIARGAAIALLLFVCSFASGCPPPETPPPRDIDLGGLSLVVGSNPDMVCRSFTFFVGPPNQGFEMNLDVSSASVFCPVSVVSGGGTVIDRITTNGPRTVRFPGNVGVLRLLSDSLTRPPGLTVNSIRVFPSAGPQLPAVPEGLADNVPAMPLSLNSAVELPFATSATTYFLVLKGVGGKTIEIVLDGPGGLVPRPEKVLVSTDAEIGFVLGEDTADEVIRGSAGGFGRLTLNPERDTLFLTVQSEGVAGAARLSVNEPPPAGLISLKARFWTLTAVDQPIIDSLTAAINTTNQTLYRVTAGRVRINSLTVYTRALAGGLADADIMITNVTGMPTSPITLPGGKILFDFNGPAGPATSGVILAQQILHAKFGLPVEQVGPCPNSLMSGYSALTLCWPGNHNPSGNSALASAAPSSAWSTLAPQLSAPVPVASPPHILRTNSTVTFPLSVITKD